MSFLLQPIDATDADIGPNADIRYSLVWSSEDVTSWCELDEQTGALRAMADYYPAESIDIYVAIQATDQALVETDRR